MVAYLFWSADMSATIGRDDVAGLGFDNTTIGSPFFFQSLFSDEWQSQDPNGIRVFVLGSAVPEPCDLGHDASWFRRLVLRVPSVTTQSVVQLNEPNHVRLERPPLWRSFLFGAEVV